MLGPEVALTFGSSSASGGAGAVTSTGCAQSPFEASESRLRICCLLSRAASAGDRSAASGPVGFGTKTSINAAAKTSSGARLLGPRCDRRATSDEDQLMSAATISTSLSLPLWPLRPFCFLSAGGGARTATTCGDEIALAFATAALISGAALAGAVATALVVFDTFFFFRLTFSPSLAGALGLSSGSFSLALALDFGTPALAGGCGGDDFAAEGFACGADGPDFGSVVGLGALVLAADFAFGAGRVALDLVLALSCLAAGFGFFCLVTFAGGAAGDVDEAEEDSDCLAAFFAMVFFTGMALVAFGLGRGGGEGELDDEDGKGFFVAFKGFF